MLISTDELNDVNKLKNAHPEIQHWSDKAVWDAYGGYCNAAMQAYHD